MAQRRNHAADLARIERKLDRLTRFVVAVLLCQPVLLVAMVMPTLASQGLTYALLALLAVLAAFPKLESRLPDTMQRLGRFVGRFRRSGATVPEPMPTAPGTGRRPGSGRRSTMISRRSANKAA